MPAPKKSTKTSSKAATPASLQSSSTAVVEAPTQATAASNNGKSAATLNNSKSTGTQVVAQIDVGFGNKLTIRGEGAGLSWQKGQAMAWQNSAWTWGTNSKDNCEFKVLLNDQTWAQGENLKAKAGQKVVFKPQF